MNYSQLPSKQQLDKTIQNIQNRGVTVILKQRKEEALAEIIQRIPRGATVMNGSSTTLQEIGFSDLLKSGNSGWNNLHETVLAEQDMAKQADLRRKAITEADYFLGSINAISTEGHLVAVDATGSRVSAYPFAAKKLILVAGYQKITPDLPSAMQRVREYVFPLENERAKKAYGRGSTLGKWVIMEREVIKDRTTLILVEEKLGF